MSEAIEGKQEEDLDLYYKIYAKFKPEMGESNAESVARTDAVEAEYRLRKNLKKGNRKEEKRVNKHYLSPFQPIQPAPRFHSQRPPSPIVEPIALNLTGDQYKNHVQQVTIDTDHGLYDNPDKLYTRSSTTLARRYPCFQQSMLPRGRIFGNAYTP
jgi:hypothetical protein